MTCIVGLEHSGKVWIGGDSAGSSAHFLTVRVDEKAWVEKEFAFGFTTSFRMGQLLRYGLTAPLERYEVDASPEAEIRFMSTVFIDRVRRVLKEGGFARQREGAEVGGTFLVGWRGKLYMVHDDFQVGRAAQGYYAVGSGGAHAIGALHALTSSRHGPENRCLRALQAASDHCTSVKRPFKVVSA